MLDVTDLYRENDYLKLYPDVATAVQLGNFATGWEHFQEFGQNEARNPGAFFNESYYLELYPDVVAAIGAGTFKSGLDHYLSAGQFEARESTPLFSEQLYRQANGDVVAAIDSLTGSLVNCLQHFIAFGDSEGRDAHARTVILWDEAAQQAVLNGRVGPTIASRAYGMVHTAIFDAWATYDPQTEGTQFNLQLPAEVNTLINKSEAISYAAYQTLVDLFPTQVELFNGVMAKLGYSLENIPTDINTPSGVGVAAADALLNYRHQDGSNQLNQYADTTGYQPVNTPDAIIDPNLWQPLRSPFNDPNGTVQRYLTPHWRTIIPFALESGDQFRPPAPAPFGSLEYEQQAAEVLEISGNLTDEQKIIAEFWEDGPGTSFPPGKWMSFGQFVSARDTHTLDQDVQLFFLLGNAVMDAGIAAWDAKAAYDYVRPITAIRLLYEGVPVSAWGGSGSRNANY